MTYAEEQNNQIVRAYLNALQNGESGDDLRRFFTENVRQIETPNQLNSRGQESDLVGILERSRQGLKVLKEQHYEIVSELAHADRVAVCWSLKFRKEERN